MSDSLTAGEPVAMIKVGARRGDSAGKPRMPAKFLLIATVLPALLVGNLAMAQVDEPFDGTVTPTPMMGATSPLGITTGSTSSPAGIPFGATEITSPGLSPLPTGVTGTITIPTTGSGTACSTVAGWQSGPQLPLQRHLRAPPRCRRHRRRRHHRRRHR